MTDYVALGRQLAQAPETLDRNAPWTGASGGRCWAVGLVQDVSASLAAGEAALITGAVAKRRAEFATGRQLAHAALHNLGRPVATILAAERRPLWPPGVVGSITHSTRLAAAVVASADELRGLGVDAELCGAVDHHLLARVLTPSERELYGDRIASDDFATMLFSAKEAVYKAINPTLGVFVDFIAVEIDVQGEEYRARYLGADFDPRLLRTGRGSFVRRWDHWVTQFELREAL